MAYGFLPRGRLELDNAVIQRDAVGRGAEPLLGDDIHDDFRLFVLAHTEWEIVELNLTCVQQGMQPRIALDVE